MQRQVAFRLNIKDVIQNPIKREGNLTYIELDGKKIIRVCLMGTIVSKFVSEDQNYVSITIDDSTDTIRIKLWRTDDNLIDRMIDLKIGDLIDVVGRIREYDDEVYIYPEAVVKVEDPNAFIARKLEIKELRKILPKIKQEFEEAKPLTALDLIKKGFKTIEEMKANSNLSGEELKSQILKLMESGEIYEPKKGVYELV